MSLVLTAEKFAEIKNYEAQMSDYFSHYSAKLREWYLNGGDESDDYRLQCSKLREEYDRYMKYIQQFRALIVSSTTASCSESDQFPTDTSQSNTSHHIVCTLASQNATASAAADYTRYYKDMIAYFGKLLASIPQTQGDSDDSSDDDLINQNQSGLATKKVNSKCTLSINTVSNAEDYDTCSDPRAVMREYFDRYVETGQWDWASWNNYLSWIARSNPKWYKIFVHFSREMGIDWDDMYEKWSTSVGSRMPPTSFQKEASVTSDIPLIVNYPVQNNFTSEVISKDPEVGEHDSNYCPTCEQHFDTERIFAIHLRGVKHTQLLLQMNGTGVNESTVNEESWEAKYHSWMKSQYMNEAYATLDLSGKFYCELCRIEFQSHKDLGSHLNGRRHRENVEIFEKTGDVNLLKDKPILPTKLVAKLQPLLDVCTKPIIGLHYLIEYQLENMDDCLYLCDLCYQWLPISSVISHLCNYNHRKTYLSVHYIDLYKIIEFDQSEVNLQTQRLEVYARKIEDFEGRKRLTVERQDVSNLEPVLSDVIDNPQPVIAQNTEHISDHEKINIPSDSSASSQVDELEEGEVSDESSSESECKLPSVKANTSEATSSFFIRYAHIIGCIEKQRQSGDDKPISVQESLMTVRESETYIRTLKADGLLNLKDPNNINTTVKSDLKSKFVEQFACEADWVLDKMKQLKASQLEETKQIVADISATARIRASQLEQHERISNLSRSVDVHEQTRSVLQSGYYNSHLLKVNQNCSVSVGSITPCTVANTTPTTRTSLPVTSTTTATTVPITSRAQTVIAPPPTAHSLTLVRPILANIPTVSTTVHISKPPAVVNTTSKHLALSNSAIHAIRSAIDSLKSTRQFMTPPVIPSIKNNALRPATELTDVLSHSTLSSKVSTHSSPDVNSLSLQPQEPTKLEPPTSNLESIVDIDQIMIAKRSRVDHSLTVKSTVVGASSPIIDELTNCVGIDSNLATQQTSRSSANKINGQSVRSLNNAKIARQSESQSTDLQACATSPPDGPNMQSDFTSKLTELSASTKTGSESIFDAYSLFSRRCEQRKQARLQKREISKQPSRSSLRSTHQNETTSNVGAGRRLSAIADFLGMNEPPSTLPKRQPSNQLSSTVQFTTPSYPSFSSSNTSSGFNVLNEIINSLIPSSHTSVLNQQSFNLNTNVTYSTQSSNCMTTPVVSAIEISPVIPNILPSTFNLLPQPTTPILPTFNPAWPLYTNLTQLPTQTDGNNSSLSSW